MNYETAFQRGIRGASFLMLGMSIATCIAFLWTPATAQCSNTQAVGRLAGAPVSSAPTTTCADGTGCGFTVTWGYNGWDCATSVDFKCLDDPNAPQVVVAVYACDNSKPAGMQCVGTQTTVQTMPGKKTERC